MPLSGAYCSSFRRAAPAMGTADRVITAATAPARTLLCLMLIQSPPSNCDGFCAVSSFSAFGLPSCVVPRNRPSAGSGMMLILSISHRKFLSMSQKIVYFCPQNCAQSVSQTFEPALCTVFRLLFKISKCLQIDGILHRVVFRYKVCILHKFRKISSYFR